MFNLKKQSNNLKGEIGEVIAKRKIKYVFRTKELHPEFLEKDIFPFNEMSKEIRGFLKEYWYTIDLFRTLKDREGNLNLELFEVKIINYYSRFLRTFHKIPKITSSSLDVYKKAIARGFKVKLVKIIFFDNWRYNVIIKDFDPRYFIIQDKPYPLKYKK